MNREADKSAEHAIGSEKREGNELVKIRAGSVYKFKQKTPSDSREYLETALGAEKYISQYAKENETEIYWKKSGATWSSVPEEEVDLSFYSGNAGILFFYLKLYEITKEERFLNIIDKSVNYISKRWREYFKQTPIFGAEFMVDGFYMGIGGIGLVLLEVYRQTKNETAQKGAREIYEYYKGMETTAEDGIFWTDSPAVAMDGGIILYFIEIYRSLGIEEAAKTVEKAAVHYLNRGIPHGDALEFRGWPGPGTRPNYEFGTAGAGYVLAVLYEFLKDEKYIEAAKKCDRYMRSIKIEQKKGYLHPYDEEMEEPMFFLSSCHGTGGNSKLYYKLYELTKDEDYLKQIKQMVAGIESVGAPERTSKGFWNTLCFCCGHAGLIHYFLGLHASLGDEKYHELAERTAAVILGEAEHGEDGTVKWPMAFWRVKPDFLTIDLGFYDGIAGVATALLEMYAHENTKYKWNRLIDDPFES